MEWTLHQQLKARYGTDRGGQVEVGVDGFRIDAVDPSGRLVEIQTGDLGPLRPKLRHLLPTHRVLVVKPVPVRRRIRWRDQAGPDRRSPWRGSLLDGIESLVGLVGVFPDVNLGVEMMAVEVVEVRAGRRRRGRGPAVVDRALFAVGETVRIDTATDLWGWLPPGLDATAFTTLCLAAKLGRPLAFAQRVAYLLLHSGAVEVVGKRGSHRVYARREVSAGDGPTGRTRSVPTGRGR